MQGTSLPLLPLRFDSSGVTAHFWVFFCFFSFLLKLKHLVKFASFPLLSSQFISFDVGNFVVEFRNKEKKRLSSCRNCQVVDNWPVVLKGNCRD